MIWGRINYSISINKEALSPGKIRMERALFFSVVCKHHNAIFLSPPCYLPTMPEPWRVVVAAGGDAWRSRLQLPLGEEMKPAPNQVLAVKPSSINTLIFYCLSGRQTIPGSPAAATIPMLCGARRSALESCYYSVIGAISDCYCSSPCGGGDVPLVGALPLLQRRSPPCHLVSVGSRIEKSCRC